MQGQWYTQKWIARNGIEERTKFFVRTGYTKGERAKRAAKKESKRTDSAERQAARYLNENFEAKEDIHAVLEYTDKELEVISKKAKTIAAESEADRLYIAAQQNFVNFVRRVQRELKKSEQEIFYLAVTSDMDGETGEAVRIHHHIVCNKEAKAAIEKKWRGFVLQEQLYTINGDFTPLAEYMIRQTRAVEGTQRYVPSRNLRQPYKTEPKLVSRYGDSEMHVPKGCVEIYRSVYTRGATQYLRYRRPPKAERSEPEKRNEQSGENAGQSANNANRRQA